MHWGDFFWVRKLHSELQSLAYTCNHPARMLIRPKWESNKISYTTTKNSKRTAICEQSLHDRNHEKPRTLERDKTSNSLFMTSSSTMIPTLWRLRVYRLGFRVLVLLLLLLAS